MEHDGAMDGNKMFLASVLFCLQAYKIKLQLPLPTSVN